MLDPDSIRNTENRAVFRPLELPYLIKRQRPEARLHGVEYPIHHKERAGEPECLGRVLDGAGRLLVIVYCKEHAYALLRLCAPISLISPIGLLQELQLFVEIALLHDVGEVMLDISDDGLQAGEVGHKIVKFLDNIRRELDQSAPVFLLIVFIVVFVFFSVALQ
jgi:hypothetical protein